MSLEILNIFPESVGIGAVLLMAATSFLASLIAVSVGLGGGILLLGVLATFLPAHALIPVHGVVQLGSNATRAALLARHVHFAALPAFAAGALVGVVIGGSIAVDLPGGAVQAGVGVFILWSIFAHPPILLRKWPVLTGVVSSFLTMFFGATGPFVANVTKSYSLPRHSHVATHAALMTIQHLLKIVTFGILGFAFAPWLGLIGVLIAAGFLGTLTGRLLLNQISDHDFHRALNMVLVIIACGLIWRGALQPLFAM